MLFRSLTSIFSSSSFCPSIFPHPSHSVHLPSSPSHSLAPHPTLIHFCSSSTLFVSLHLSFLPCLHPSISHFLSPSLTLSVSASSLLGSCGLIGMAGGLASRHSLSVLAVCAHPAPWSLINESSVVFVYQAVIC